MDARLAPRIQKLGADATLAAGMCLGPCDDAMHDGIKLTARNDRIFWSAYHVQSYAARMFRKRHFHDSRQTAFEMDWEPAEYEPQALSVYVNCANRKAGSQMRRTTPRFDVAGHDHHSASCV